MTKSILQIVNIYTFCTWNSEMKEAGWLYGCTGQAPKEKEELNPNPIPNPLCSLYFLLT